MTTYKRPLSTRNNGNNATAQRRTAENNRCPKCGRKSSLKYHSDNVVYGSYCWRPDCDYENFLMFRETRGSAS